MIVTLARGLLYSTLSNTPQQIAEKALASTVSLDMQDSNGATLTRGSGFFVRHNLIATNHHVIKGAAQGAAKLVSQETKYIIEGVTANDKTNDLALLKVTMQGINPLPLGDSDTARIGDAIYVAGSPQGWEGTFSNGIISGLREESSRRQLQMTAPISTGSSGGPVLNDKGEVIGVCVSSVYRGHETQNLNFASYSNALKELLERSGPVRSLSQENRTTSVDTYLTQGSKKEKLRDYKGAIVNYTEAIRLKPDFAQAYFKRGLAKVALKRYEDAIIDYDTAIRFKPNYNIAYNNRGLAKASLGQHDAAITDYDTAIRLNPNYAIAYNGQGSAKTKLGQHEAAIADFNTAIRLKPNYDTAYYGRGLARYGLGQYSIAIADFDIAIQLKPDYADAYFNRGNAKAKLGHHFAAITDYDTAIRLKPNYALAYGTRAKSKLSLGRTSEAKQDLRTTSRLIKTTDDQNLKTKIELLLQKID